MIQFFAICMLVSVIMIFIGGIKLWDRLFETGLLLFMISGLAIDFIVLWRLVCGTGLH